MVNEMKSHLLEKIIPFWKALKDEEFGGYYGYMDYDLKVDTNAVKGCILNSRIMWFFSNAYTLLKDESLLAEAEHGFSFMKEHCMDKENGGIFWSIKYNGEPEDTTKHTYNQAFAIYALSSYYEASKDEEALSMAKELFHIIEERCTILGELIIFNFVKFLIECFLVSHPLSPASVRALPDPHTHSFLLALAFPYTAASSIPRVKGLSSH